MINEAVFYLTYFMDLPKINILKFARSFVKDLYKTYTTFFREMSI